MHIHFNQDHYVVSQFTGYALSDLGKKCIKKHRYFKLSEKLETIIGEKNVFEMLYNCCFMSSHYIEDSLFYTDYEKTMKKHRQEFTREFLCEITKNLSKEEETAYFENLDELLKVKLFESTKEDLKNSYIKKEEVLYRLPYLFNEQQLGFRKIIHTWFVYENGELKEYSLPPKYLSCIIDQNGGYFHIEPNLSLGKDDFTFTPIPISENRIIEEGKNSFHHMYDNMVIDMIDFGLLKKIKIK